MRIAFWSNAKEKCGVSSNLALFSIASVIRFPYSIMVLENHLSRCNLGKLYLRQPKVMQLKEAGSNYYEGGGIEGLIRKIYRGGMRDGLLQDNVKEILQNHLYYIPQSGVINSEIFDYEFNECIHIILKILDSYTDISLFDAANRSNLSTKTILNEADLIVVNLCQDPDILDDFFNNYSSLIPKSIILIGKYSRQSIFSMKKISRMYDVPMDRMAAVPYSEMLYESYCYGSLVDFVSCNYYCDRNNPNYLFIQAIRKTAGIIMKAAEQTGKLIKEDKDCKLQLC